ncbi:MAG: hypothetical protein LBV42_06060 [Methanobrevibacter sp.]|jgi:hypothetical protein|nr:hypothetical protein [Methanobrevibacter sp.]
MNVNSVSNKEIEAMYNKYVRDKEYEVVYFSCLIDKYDDMGNKIMVI